MKRANNLIKQSQVLAQVFLLLCTYACMPAGLAAPKPDLDYTDLDQLARLETTIYGSPHKNLPNEKRVDSLEKILFGKTHSGALHPRIFAIASTLTGKADNSLSPPLAPSLDRGDTLKGAAPRMATESNKQPDENESLPPSEAKRDRIKNGLQQAMQLYSQGQTSQAEAIFKNILSLDSRNEDANYNLGTIAESRSDWENALHYYQNALASNPNDEDTQKAVESMKTKIATARAQKQSRHQQTKLSSQQIDALKNKVNQAGSEYAAGNYDAAISNLKEVAAQAPDQADVFYALGQAYKAKNQNSEAANAFSQAVKLAPNNKQYADALAQLNNSQGKAQNTENRGTDTFSSNNPDLGKKQSKLANKDKSDWTPDPAGEITPFPIKAIPNWAGNQPGLTTAPMVVLTIRPV